MLQIKIEEEKLNKMESDQLSKFLKSNPTFLFTKHVYELNYFADSNKFMTFGGSKFAIERDSAVDPIRSV